MTSCPVYLDQSAVIAEEISQVRGVKYLQKFIYCENCEEQWVSRDLAEENDKRYDEAKKKGAG